MFAGLLIESGVFDTIDPPSFNQKHGLILDRGRDEVPSFTAMFPSIIDLKLAHSGSEQVDEPMLMDIVVL